MALSDLPQSSSVVLFLDSPNLRTGSYSVAASGDNITRWQDEAASAWHADNSTAATNPTAQSGFNSRLCARFVRANSEFLALPNGTDIARLRPLTIALRFRLTTLPGGGTGYVPIATGAGANYGWKIECYENDSIYLIYRNSSTTLGDPRISWTPQANRWYLVVFSLASTGNCYGHVYDYTADSWVVSASLSGPAFGIPTGDIQATPSGNLVRVGSSSVPDSNFNGDIDLVAVWESAALATSASVSSDLTTLKNYALGNDSLVTAGGAQGAAYAGQVAAQATETTISPAGAQAGQAAAQVAYSADIAPDGSQATATAGQVAIASTEVTPILTGAQALATAGQVAYSADIAPDGSQATATGGQVSAVTEAPAAPSGAVATASAGQAAAQVVELTIAPQGAQAATTAGQVTAGEPSEADAAPAGAQAATTAGQSTTISTIAITLLGPVAPTASGQVITSQPSAGKPLLSPRTIRGLEHVAVQAMQMGSRCTYTAPADPAAATTARDTEGQPLPSSALPSAGMNCHYVSKTGDYDRLQRRGDSTPTLLDGEVWLPLSERATIKAGGTITLTHILGRQLPHPIVFTIEGAPDPGLVYLSVPLRRLVV